MNICKIHYTTQDGHPISGPTQGTSKVAGQASKQQYQFNGSSAFKISRHPLPLFAPHPIIQVDGLDLRDLSRVGHQCSCTLAILMPRFFSTGSLSAPNPSTSSPGNYARCTSTPTSPTPSTTQPLKPHTPAPPGLWPPFGSLCDLSS